MREWYCSYCDRMVPDTEATGDGHHAQGKSGGCGWQMWPMGEKEARMAALSDAATLGHGYIRYHPDGRVEHIPAEQVRLFFRQNPNED